MRKYTLLILLLTINTALAVTWTTNDQSGFNEGTHSTTQWSTDHVEISSGTSGTYTSKVFDCTTSCSWDTITWAPGLPYQQDLPDSGASDSGANMNGNLLLMHLDESSGQIQDTSGNSNHATNTGADYAQTGKFSNSLLLSCGGDVVEANSYTYVFTTEITMAAWFKYTGQELVLQGLLRYQP